MKKCSFSLRIVSPYSRGEKTPKKVQNCQNSKNCPRSTFRGDLLLGRSIQGAPRIPPAPLVTCRSQVCLFRSLLSLCLFYWLFEGLYVLWIGGGCVKRVLGYLVVLRTLWKVEILGNRPLGRCWGGPAFLGPPGSKAWTS